MDSKAKTTDRAPASNAAAVNSGAAGRGVILERFFTTAGVDPYSQVEWDLRAAVISGEDGRIVFEQKDVEVPRGWSQTAPTSLSRNISVARWELRGARPASASSS